MATAVNEAPVRAPYLVIDGFLPGDVALAMRADIDAHFAAPEAHRAETHQVWNYWYIPELYTYLRTTPEKVIDPRRVQRFFVALTDWSMRTLGMGFVTWPYLSLYVGGCRQSIHNDSTNGRFGFVYSLTRDKRATIGGETLILREGDPFRANLTTPSAGRGFAESIAPVFNRLVVFDDRMPQAVECVEGSMDPVEGRFVLHGHIAENGLLVAGALSRAAVEDAVGATVAKFVAELTGRPERFHGPVVLRFTVRPDGNFGRGRILVDRVARGDGASAGAEAVSRELLSRIGALRFLPAEGETEVTLPVAVGGPLPGRRA